MTMDKWVRRNWVYLVFLAGAMMLTLGLTVEAKAMEINGARATTFFTGGLDTVSVAVDGDDHWTLPDGYLMWTGDGSEFRVGRYINGSFESVYAHIPASRSLILPAPSAVDVDGVGWSHIFNVSTTDTVFIIPVDK